ncbi:uncharacterized protein [Lepidochelys kempii]|uniref:uncharacterized protein n=1 Tax=Lepidochelys kempii TaxID=8472 RepID=UPI003C6EA540
MEKRRKDLRSRTRKDLGEWSETPEAGTFPTSKWGTVSCIHVQHSSVRAQLCRPASGKMGVHCPSISMERLAKASLSSPAILGCRIQILHRGTCYILGHMGLPGEIRPSARTAGLACLVPPCSWAGSSPPVAPPLVSTPLPPPRHERVYEGMELPQYFHCRDTRSPLVLPPLPQSQELDPDLLSPLTHTAIVPFCLSFPSSKAEGHNSYNRRDDRWRELINV